jgi:hypothetical protein
MVFRRFLTHLTLAARRQDGHLRCLGVRGVW